MLLFKLKVPYNLISFFVASKNIFKENTLHFSTLFLTFLLVMFSLIPLNNRQVYPSQSPEINNDIEFKETLFENNIDNYDQKYLKCNVRDLFTYDTDIAPSDAENSIYETNDSDLNVLELDDKGLNDLFKLDNNDYNDTVSLSRIGPKKFISERSFISNVVEKAVMDYNDQLLVPTVPHGIKLRNDSKVFLAELKSTYKDYKYADEKKPTEVYKSTLYESKHFYRPNFY